MRPEPLLAALPCGRGGWGGGDAKRVYLPHQPRFLSWMFGALAVPQLKQGWMNMQPARQSREVVKMHQPL